MGRSARTSLLIIGLLLFSMTSLQVLKSEINFWNIYGVSSTAYWRVQNDYVTNGYLAAEILPNGPTTDPSGDNSKYLWQTVNINPDYSYNLSGYILFNSTRYTKAYLRIMWYPELDGGGGNLGDVESTYVTNVSSDFVFRSITNVSQPSGTLSCKIELYFYYYKWIPFESIYFDNIMFTSSENSDVNLLQNGDFEYGWNYPVPSASTKSYEIFAYPKIFTPRGYDKLCSINIKINKVDSFVRVELLSLKGIVKKVFYSGILNSLNTSILWEGTDDKGVILPMGIYILKMKVIEYENNVPKEKEFKSLVVLGNNLR